jgi:hypothetical protein
MRAYEFDIHQRMYDLKGEIEAITVIVRQMRERQASGDVAAAEARLAAARVQLQQLSQPPPRALGTLPPKEF